MPMGPFGTALESISSKVEIAVEIPNEICGYFNHFWSPVETLVFQVGIFVPFLSYSNTSKMASCWVEKCLFCQILAQNHSKVP